MANDERPTEIRAKQRTRIEDIPNMEFDEHTQHWVCELPWENTIIRSTNKTRIEDLLDYIYSQEF